MSGTTWTVVVLALAVFGSALGVVYSQHRARALFIELQRLEATQAELDTEWGRLELEQSTWATHGRIERLAREMKTPVKGVNVGLSQVEKVSPEGGETLAHEGWLSGCSGSSSSRSVTKPPFEPAGTITAACFLSESATSGGM